MLGVVGAEGGDDVFAIDSCEPPSRHEVTGLGEWVGVGGEHGLEGGGGRGEVAGTGLFPTALAECDRVGGEGGGGKEPEQ